MKWLEENKHIVVILLLIVSLFVVYRYVSSELQSYRTNMRTVDILTEKNRLLSQIDEKKLADEVQKLQDVVNRASILFINGSEPPYEIQSYMFRYVKALMENVGASEFKSVKLGRVTVDKKNPTWGSITVSVDGIRGPKTYEGIINMLQKIEMADKIVVISNVNIKYAEGEEYPYTISLSMQFPVAIMEVSSGD